MATGLAEREGTIAYVLDENKEELFELINAGNVGVLRQRVFELLDDERIKDKKAVLKAKSILSRPNTNLFLSTLMTYLTGMKVS